jgi:CheY-like chemotaxis protein
MNQATLAGIMVVGSDSHFSYLMRRYVRTSSHQIIFANPGKDVLALARREKPAAIVLEADLPDNMGWHTLRALKADQTTGKIPVILCSWLDEKERGSKEGADVYLQMPILYEDFGAALSHIGLHPCA